MPEEQLVRMCVEAMYVCTSADAVAESRDPTSGDLVDRRGGQHGIHVARLVHEEMEMPGVVEVDQPLLRAGGAAHAYACGDIHRIINCAAYIMMAGSGARHTCGAISADGLSQHWWRK